MLNVLGPSSSGWGDEPRRFSALVDDGAASGVVWGGREVVLGWRKEGTVAAEEEQEEEQEEEHKAEFEEGNWGLGEGHDSFEPEDENVGLEDEDIVFDR